MSIYLLLIPAFVAAVFFIAWNLTKYTFGWQRRFYTEAQVEELKNGACYE